MGYGLEVYKSDGSFVVKADDKLTRFIDYFEVSSNSNGQKDYPILQGQEILAIPSKLGTGFAPPIIEINGTTITWSSESNWTSSATGITVVAVG